MSTINQDCETSLAPLVKKWLVNNFTKPLGVFNFTNPCNKKEYLISMFNIENCPLSLTLSLLYKLLDKFKIQKHKKK